MTDCDHAPDPEPWLAHPGRLLLCLGCDSSVIAREVGVVQQPPAEGKYGLGTRVVLHECMRCSRAILTIQEPINGRWGEPQQIWPAGMKTLSEKIPDSLRRELYEARACFDAKAFTAAVVMVRRTLEGVCAEHQIRVRPLQRALREMASQNLLDGRLLEWADGLRVLGNEGAHYTGSSVSREDASDALALAEAVLDYLYVLAAQYEEFKERRQRRNQHAEPDSNRD